MIKINATVMNLICMKLNNNIDLVGKITQYSLRQTGIKGLACHCPDEETTHHKVKQEGNKDKAGEIQHLKFENGI